MFRLKPRERPGTRNQEIGATNSDLRNLLAAVSVAILMIDQDLRIRRFNAAAEKLACRWARDSASSLLKRLVQCSG